MNAGIFYWCGRLALSFPFLAISLLLVHYFLRRAIYWFKKRRGKKILGFCPSSAALGMIFLFAQAYYQPSVSHVLEVKQEEDLDEDDQGDPETIPKQFNRQLKRIRRGDPVDTLVVRL